MNQESLETIIERLQRDRQAITDKMNQRNQLFEKANQNYQSNNQRELETIKIANKQAQSRDLEFRQYIIQLFKTYDEGNKQMKLVIQQTINQKINYNEFLIKNFPQENSKEKKELQEENLKLRQEMELYLSKVNILAQEAIPQIEIKDQEFQETQQIEQYLGGHIETNIQNQQQIQIPNNSTNQSLQNTKQKFGPENQNNQELKLNKTQKKQEIDLLQSFLMPQKGRI
ncbi:unnamed protein product [Paramecium sonneborni]|uniref:Uncharacterized protein n=1 Tax=Paramecium sonneborni TaxID=65129 RepID=A0A8S1L9U2_9CILI|nr:unnamed protein product [Paramecium sonneborni]